MIKEIKEIILFLLIIVSLYIVIKLSSPRLNSAIIVEPRKHAALEKVIMNIYNNLNIPIIIFHGTENEDFVKNIVDRNCINKYQLVNIDKKNLNIPSYNKLLYSLDFWEKASYFGDKILLFQTDSGIYGQFSDIKDILQYDFCGAPWLIKGHTEFNAVKYFSKEFNNSRPVFVGNGGFSLRSCKMMIKLINKYNPLGFKNIIPEDVFFANACDMTSGCKLSNVEDAKKFSIAYPAEFPYKSFGFHQYWKACEFGKEIEKLQYSLKN